MTHLPDRPSALIRLALLDLAKVEADRRYVVDMSEWHYPQLDGCHVCFAGAVLAGTCGEDITTRVDMTRPRNSDLRRKLMALDEFRLGDVTEGLIIMGIEPIEDLEFYDVPRYSDDPAGFRAALTALADALEAL